MTPKVESFSLSCTVIRGSEEPVAKLLPQGLKPYGQTGHILAGSPSLQRGWRARLPPGVGVGAKPDRVRSAAQGPAVAHILESSSRACADPEQGQVEGGPPSAPDPSGGKADPPPPSAPDLRWGPDGPKCALTAGSVLLGNVPGEEPWSQTPARESHLRGTGHWARAGAALRGCGGRG